MLVCIPNQAVAYFLEHYGKMEVLIVVGGVCLFSVQMILAWRALRWRGVGFDEGADRWLSNLAQAAEWFPMLGLIGTVAGILDAFAQHGQSGAIQPYIIAPAITATGAGLFMALINILPTWIVILGRDMILLLSGTPRPQPPGECAMIQMPRRNVTRFFIPLIDVLILLFCIFLLMEVNSESDLSTQAEVVEIQAGEVAVLKADQVRRSKELAQFEEDRPKLIEFAKLRKELEDLKNASRQNLQNQVEMRIIDIDDKGLLSFYDEKRPKMPILIRDAKTANDLIERQKAEAGQRLVYYYFLFPRDIRFPITAGQAKTYREWFKGVPNSLEKVSS